MIARQLYLLVLVAMAGTLAPLAMAEESGGSQVQVAPPTIVEEMVVLGKFVPDEKRDTSEISNVLDAEVLDLLSDSNVGEALSRVTGLSLVDGKYVYVRGLGERYSASLLNGYRISSPVPFQRTVPLDIVPKNIIANVLVQKTYSAQYPGDFSGGVVDMRTKATPDENYFTLTVKGGGNGATTGGDGLNYKGGSDDFWGYDDGTRQIPANISSMSSEQFESFRYPEKAALGNSFYNLWEVRENDDVPMDFGMEGELGRLFEFGEQWNIGVLVSGKFDNKWRNRDKDFRRYEFSGVEGDEGTQTVDYQQFTTTNRVELSGFGNLGIEYGQNHAVKLSSVVLRQTTDETQQARGLSSEDDVAFGTAVENYRYQWTENEIISHSVLGEHYFPALSESLLQWRYVNGKASRQSPDTRTYSYADNNDGLQEVVTTTRQAAGDLREVFQAPDRNYSRLKDDIEEIGIDIEVPFLVGEVSIDVKAGWSDYERVRETKDRLFRFDLTSSAEDFVGLMQPKDLFATPNWASGALTVSDFSARAANASGIFPFAESGEEATSFYIAVDAQVTPRMRIQAGVRDEDTTLFADAWGGNVAPDTDNAVEQNYSDFLPSASMTWELINDMQVRLAYSETVNRPSLTEITGNTIRNPEDDKFYRGNVFLQPADVTNYDARWEWYFGAADSMSLGLFKKDIKDPIELGKVQAQNDIFTWFNGDKAKLEGVEYEIQKDLSLASWFGWPDAWEYFRVTANVSYIDSEVTLLGEGETAVDVPLTGGRQLKPLFSNQRPITGQSDWLGNLMLSYVNYEWGLEGSLAYNYTDDRIVLVGERNNPDIVEEGRGKLDLLVKYTFEVPNSEIELAAKVTNIFNEPIKWTQGGNLYENYKEGVSYEFAFTVNF